MRAGRLRHRVKVQQKVVTRDAYGQEVITWQTHREVMAGIEPQTGREFYEADGQQREATTRVAMRYVPGVTTAMRLLHDTTVYDVLAIINPDMRNRELILMCEAVNQ